MAEATAAPKVPVKKKTVDILYNGRTKEFGYRAQQTVHQLLEEALDKFHITANRHIMALFKNGEELQDSNSLDQAGVKPGDELVLRQSVVKGG